jgi:hypothetical protein
MDWIDASPHVVKDLDDAMDFVWGRLGDAARAEFRDTPPDKLWQFHHGFGRALRNELGLWHDPKPAVRVYFEDQLGVSHPDDISSIIVHALYCKVNGTEFDLAAKLQYFNDYWAGKDKES